MNTPEPRLNKLPFILTDVGCLVATALIGLFIKDPFAPLPLILCVTLVIAGGIALLIPFFSDYAADCREATARLSNELEEQINRVQAAGESLERSAAQIKAIEEAVHKSARDAETLPYRMQEKLAEFNEALAAKETEDREALELELEELRSVNSGNLKSVADKIQKATADWTALEASTRKQLALAQEAAAKTEALLKNSLARIETKVANGAPQAIASPAPVHEEAITRPAVPQPVPVPAEKPAPAAPVAPAASVEPVPAKKPRPPRKSKPEDTLLAMSASPAVAEPAEADSSESAQTGDGEASADGTAKIESSSSDGATRLLTTAYIGIGNKLFIRGDGPGLSWDRGVPMQFVSIGKWGWATHDATGPVRVKLYKNDETAALTGELVLEPSRHTEITALF